MNKINCLVTVCARGGSKGIPGKNIKPVGGKPLLAYTAGIARRFAEAHGFDLAFSTDSQQIKEVADACGLPTDYTRPESLAGDVVGKPAAILDLMLWAEKKYGKRYDFVIDLDVTSPIRTTDDIEECLRRIHDDPEALTIFSVSPCGRNPYFNQVAERPDGYYGVAIGDGTVTARQKAPKVYDINGSVYVYRREALDCPAPKAISPRTLIYEMDHLCFDLDEPQDYDYLAYLLDTGRLSLDN